jgi:hypothetical protein
VRVSPETFETRVNPDSKLAEDRDRQTTTRTTPGQALCPNNSSVTSHHLEARKQHSKLDRDQVGRPSYQIGKTYHRRNSHHQYSARIELRAAGTYIHTRTPLGHRIAHSRTPPLHHATRSTRTTSHLCDSNRPRLDHRDLSRFD